MLNSVVERVLPVTLDDAPKMFIRMLEQFATKEVNGTTTFSCTNLNWNAITKNSIAAPKVRYSLIRDFITGVLIFDPGLLNGPQFCVSDRPPGNIILIPPNIKNRGAMRNIMIGVIVHVKGKSRLRFLDR